MITDLKPYAEYKESGLPWLGQVPRHWNLRAVRHVTKPQKGRLPKNLVSAQDAPRGSVPYLVMEYLRRQAGTPSVCCELSDDLVMAAPGDVLLLWDGANAGEFLTAKEGVVASTAALLPSAGHDRGYLYFILKQCEPKLRALSKGMGIPHVDGGILKQMQICLPPTDEQAAIVRFLDWANGRLERTIRAKRKVIALLNEQKQAIIHRAVTRGIDPSVPLKDSGVPWLGQIPAHWRISRLSQLSTRIGDGLHGTPLYVDHSPYYFINGNNLVHGRIHFKPSTRCVNENEYKRYMVALDDSSVLISINGTIGSVACYRGESIILGKSAAYINCGKDLARPFLLSFLRSPAVINFLRTEVTGTTIFNLSLASIRGLPIALPPISEQLMIAASIENMTEPVDTAISRLEREITLLREYRTRLVADVVTGKLDVREAAAALPDEEPIAEVTNLPDLDDEFIDNEDSNDSEMYE